MRTFFAYRLSTIAIDELKNVQSIFKSKNSSIRWVIPDNMHITIKFLGDTSPELILKIKEDLTEHISAFPRFSLTLNENGKFPKKKAPRVLWTGFETIPEVMKQQAYFFNSYFNSFGYDVTDRPFSPHITQCRVKTVLDNDFLSEYIRHSVKKVKFDINEIIWFESKYMNGKLHYSPLQKFKLKS